MKRILITFALILAAATCQSQKASVEKSIFGIEIEPIGLFVNNEAQLSRTISLRSELGIEFGILTSPPKETNGKDVISYATMPTLSAEPRWYYNLDKRLRKGKRIAKNSGNYFSIKVRYIPGDVFLTSSIDNPHTASEIAFIPSWGIRRVYGKHFTFETRIGVGPILYFGKYSDNIYKKQDVLPDLNARIGYTF